MNDTSGVGVLDKAVSVLAAAESGPATLAQLVDATGLARPTAHRIAVALERHRLLARDVQGRFVLGPRIAELASAAGEDRLLAVAQPVLIQLGTRPGRAPSSTGGRPTSGSAWPPPSGRAGCGTPFRSARRCR